MDENFSLGGVKIDCVHEYIYLGLCLIPSGTFANAINKPFEKSLKAMYALTKYALPDINIKTLLYLFDHTVKPVI